MAGNQLGHLEHRYLFLAAENLPQLVIGIDQAPVDRVLQLVLLDVVPDFFGDFGTRQRHAADDCGERARGRHRFHECRVRLALRAGLLGGFLGRGLLRRRFLCGLLGGLLRCRLLGTLFRGLLCSFLGSRHSSPSWWLIASMRRRWAWSQTDLLSSISVLHRNKYTAFPSRGYANSARRTMLLRRVLHRGEPAPSGYRKGYARRVSPTEASPS